MRPGRDRLLEVLRKHVSDERVLEAMYEVPRHHFVPPEHADEAWENVPLPIGNGQTISQPLVVARMCELLELRGDEKVLDIGTGSGYHAAILGRLARHVWSVERHAVLSRQALEHLRAAEVTNVTLVVGDGDAGPAGDGAVRRDQHRGGRGGGDPARAGEPDRPRRPARRAGRGRRPAARGRDP